MELRSIIQRKRGRCLNYGYDLREVNREAHPECGVSLAKPSDLPGKRIGNR